jgi:hypothetical protein
MMKFNVIKCQISTTGQWNRNSLNSLVSQSLYWRKEIMLLLLLHHCYVVSGDLTLLSVLNIEHNSKRSTYCRTAAIGLQISWENIPHNKL